MLTKWGAALGLASAGRIASGGGGNTGVPLGPFADWAALPASAQDQAFAVVLDLGLPSSYGLATYAAGDGQWKLLFGYFETLADLNAFTDPKALTAMAAVGPSLDAPDSVRYQWDGSQWLRTPDGTGYGWTLTETQLLTGGDPSGIGAVQEGDFGTYTPTGGQPILVRYKAATTVAAGAGGGTQAQWLPPEVYAGTPEIQAYLVGDEAVATDTTLNAQGWDTVARTSGTITSQTTRVRLATTGTSARASIQTLSSGVTSTTRVYVRFLYRAAIGNGTTTTATGVYFGEYGDGVGGAGLRPVYYSSVGANTFFWSGSGVANTGISATSQPTPPNLTGTDELCELYLDISTGISTLVRNGVASAASLRSSSVSVADRLAIAAFSGSAATQTATIDLSRVMVATW